MINQGAQGGGMYAALAPAEDVLIQKLFEQMLVNYQWPHSVPSSWPVEVH